MISQERLKFLQDNKQRGDIANVVKLINPKAKINGLKFSVAYDIIDGRTWGKYGKQVTDAMEKIIKDRQRILKIEKSKYAKAS